MNSEIKGFLLLYLEPSYFKALFSNEPVMLLDFIIKKIIIVVYFYSQEEGSLNHPQKSQPGEPEDHVPVIQECHSGEPEDHVPVT